MYFRVFPIKIWLFYCKKVQVPLTGCAIGFGDALPSGTAKDALPVVGWKLPIFALAVTKDISRALWRSWRGL